MTAPSPARAYLYAFVLAVAAYANAAGNGFALDDNLIVVANPVVTEGQWGEALLGPYWYGADDGSGLYRPVTTGSFTAEWRLWRGSPVGFHVVNVLLHALVTVGVLRLLLVLTTVPAALAGALFFAVHPVHTEAVANVVGRSELFVALATLTACLAYLAPALRIPRWRGARLALLCGLYLLALGSKESGVMLPALLLVLEAARSDGRPFLRRLAGEAPVWVGLSAVLAGYLTLRVAVLGAVTGGAAAPELTGVGAASRLLTALTLWPEYLRLLVFPLDLSADYAPAVLLVSRGVDAAVVAGGFILVGVAVLAWLLRRAVPLLWVGAAWFFLAVLPVSNLLFPAGILLAERTLYLPSVGASLVVAGVWQLGRQRLDPAAARRWMAVAMVAGLALFARTVDRNPTWFSTYTVMNTLAREHPESAMALRTRAMGLERVGERGEAARMWRTVLALQPNHYGFLVEASRFFAGIGERTTAADLLRHAMTLRPHDASAYRTLAEQRLVQGDGREAHAVALQGLAAAGDDAGLWALVSEAYIAKGDLEASLRARQAAVGADPASAHDWTRMADILEALERPAEAAAARSRAAALPPSNPPTPGAS